MFGEIVGMEILSSREGEALGRWILEAAKHFGAKALVSEELGRKVPPTYQVPSTNNATENAIGRGGKIRAKRMRGFKRADTILPIMFLLASLSGVLAGVPFHSLIH